MNVLSLFDGHRCGAMALQVAGVPITNHFASEIDPHAIKAANAVYPAAVNIGSVANVAPSLLPPIDLLIGGSPCQGFSFSGKQAGTKAVVNGREVLVTSLQMYLALKQIGAEFLSQSALFWEYVRILQEVRERNPDVKFLLENVRMKKEYLDLISNALGVAPVFINSNLVSGQNRPRFYWCNSETPVPLPAGKGIKLNDVLEREVSEEYLISDSYLNRVNTSTDVKKMFTVLDPEKAASMTARQYANWKGTLVTALTERRTEEAKKIRSENMNCLTACYSMKEHTLFDGFSRYRKLTPRECGRLQTVPEHHIHAMLNCGVSDAQLYKMFGNGWTVEVIAHILRNLL